MGQEKPEFSEQEIAPEEAVPETGAAPEEARKTPEAEIADLKDRLLRAMAETENVRKRAERERIEAAKYAIVPFARDLIIVADNLARALKAVPEEQKESQAVRTLIEGVELTGRELDKVFERHDVKRLDPKGEAFDANFHQAVAEVPAPSAAPGTIIEVIEAGYVLGERLVRPAMVVVAKAMSADPPPEPGTNLDTKI
jgi:molecular chaperone GrpE